MLLVLCAASLQSNAQTYCTETYTTGSTSGDYISNVTIGSINNTTAGSASPFYNYYSSLSTNVTIGSFNTLSVTGGTYVPDIYTVFIDFNHDGDFADAGESLGSDTTSVGSNTVVLGIYVPTNATLGSTRMRVICTYNTASVPCGSNNWGETEDYTLNVVSGGTSSPCSGGANLTNCSGTIDDGSGVGIFYNNNQSCSWLIQPSGATSVTISFSSFVTESGYDYVRIYNGTNASATLLATYSGSTIPASITTTTGAIYVTFTTDGSQVYEGFTANYNCNFSAAPPVAAFTANYTNINSGGSTNFTDQSTNTPTSWSWSFAGGTPATSTLQNPLNVVFTTPGCHAVTLTASNAYGSNTATQSCYINVTASGAQYCLPNPTYGTASGDFINGITLNTLSTSATGGITGPSYTYYNSANTDLNANSQYTIYIYSGTFANSNYAAWIDYNEDGDFDDSSEKLGQIQIAANTNSGITFLVPTTALDGNKIMRVRCADQIGGITNMLPCTDYSYGETEDYIVNIITQAPPTANFNVSTQNVTSGNAVTFTDLSSNAPTTWSWTLTNGTSTYNSTLQNPTFYPAVAGCYNVTLVVSNTYGSDTFTYPCIVFVSTSVYCTTAIHSVDCTNLDHINTVSITNTTLNNANTGCSSGNELGYSLWTPYGSNTATLVKGQTYTMNVTTDTASIISCWIDYDHSGTFSAGEWTQISTSSTAGVPASHSLVIPNTAQTLTGVTRMRIRSRKITFNNGAGDACTQFGSGETEDYTITLVSQSVVAPVAAFSASVTTIGVGQSVSFTDLSTNTPSSWSWTFTGANPANGINQNPVNITYPTIGCYAVSLTATNAAGSNTATQTCYINVVAAAACVTGIGGTCGSNSINGVSIASTTLSNLNNGCTTVGTDAYSSYQATGNTTATLVKGNSYNLSVNTVAGTIISVWFDYNHNGTYEATEWTQVTTGAVSTTSTVTILIPNTAQTGATGMRVRSRVSSAVNGAGDACTNFGTGECEDYTVTISSGATQPVSLFTFSPSAVCVGATATFTNASTNATTYAWTFTGGSPSTSTLANPTVTWATSGTKAITLVATNANGFASSSQNIVVNANPTANAGNDVSICGGSSTLLSATQVTNATYNWSPATGLSNANVFNPTATPAATTAYTLTVTNTNGCSATDVVNVTVNAVTAAAGNDVTICPGGSAQLTANFVSGASYFWTPSAGLSTAVNFNTTASPTTTTTYTVTVIKNGCSASDAVTVNVGAIVANAGADVTICAGSTAQLQASGGTTYQWSPSTGLSNPTIASPVCSSTITRTYTVTVSNGSCSSTDQITVTVNAAPTANAGADVSICSGATAQLGIATVSGYTYNWVSSNTVSNTSISNPTTNPTVLGANTYSLTVTNANGCTAIDVVNVTVNAGPTINLGADVSICAGASTTLNAGNAGNTFSWSPATGLNTTSAQSVTANPTSTTTYIATVTNASGCSSSDNITVTVNSVSANAGQDVTICNGSSTSLSASGGTTYSWSPSTGLNTTSAQSVTASPTSTTTYTVTATNSGCTATNSVTVNVNSVTASAGADASVCVGSSTQLLATGGTAYSWSPATGLSSTSASNPVATPASTQTYTVTVTNGSCTATDVVVVTVNSVIANAGTDASICLSSSSQLGASGGSSYSWSPSTGLSSSTVASPVATPSTTTTYTVTISNNGCSGTDAVTVNVNTASAAAGNDVTICIGNTVQLAATGGVTYSWSPTAGLSNASVANPIANPTLTTNYTVTATNGACVTQDNVTVTVATSLNVNAGADANLCSGQTLQLAATGGAQYQWTPTTGLSNANVGNPIATPTSTTTYTVTTFSGTCSSTDNITITVVAGITATAGADITLCNGNSATLTATGGTSFSWSPATGLSNATSATPTAFPTSTTTYVVTATTGGCSDMDTVVVTVGNASANAGIDVALCSGQNTTLNASGGTNYTWSPNTGLTNANIANPVATPSATTTYTVTITNGVCTATDNVTIAVSSVSVNAGADVQVCNGASAALTAQGSGATTYSWSPTLGISNPSIANPSATPTTTTLYTITVTDGLCTASDNVNVTVNANPTAPVITDNSGVLSTTTSASGYQWLLNGGALAGANASQYTPINNGTYTVVVANGNGCTAASAVYNFITVSSPLIPQGGITSVYPNPVSDVMNIEISDKLLSQNTKCYITDMLGNVMMEIQPNSLHFIVSTLNLSSGVYFVKIGNDVKKIVKE